MKRLTRRTLAALVGLMFGWYMAGLMPALLPGTEVSYAHDEPDHPAADQPAGESQAHVAHASEKLVPAEGDTPFIRPVLRGVLILFVAAVLLGPLALKFRGPEPPDPAASHGHDDHGDHGDT